MWSGLSTLIPRQRMGTGFRPSVAPSRSGSEIIDQFLSLFFDSREDPPRQELTDSSFCPPEPDRGLLLGLAFEQDREDRHLGFREPFRDVDEELLHLARVRGEL